MKNIATLLIAILVFQISPLPVLANAAQPSLLGIGQGEAPESGDRGTRPAAEAPAAPAQDGPSWWQRAGDWLGRFGRGVANGFVNAIPNLVRAFREDPWRTGLMVGGMIALGILCPPAALAVGGAMLTHAAIQTGGDPDKLGNLVGETAFWTAAGLGGARLVRGLRGGRGATTAAVAEEAGLGARGAGARPPAGARPAPVAEPIGNPSRPVSPRMNDNMAVLQQTGGRTFGMCFVAGTLVLTAQGLLPIEQVRPGDAVMAHAHRAAVISAGETLPPSTVVLASADLDAVAAVRTAPTGRTADARGLVARGVRATFRREAPAVVDVKLAARGARDWTITGTPNHPFYVPAEDRYVPMGALAVGTRLRSDTGAEVVVLAKSVRHGSFAVYNFEVDGAHNYHVAGRAGAPAVLVHNAGIPGSCAQTAPPRAATTASAPRGAAPRATGTTPPRGGGNGGTPPRAGGNGNPANPPPAPSRNAAFRQAKRDLNIPQGQQPIEVRRVPMTDRAGNRILDTNNQPVMTREYVYQRPDGSRVVIQDHGAGHQFGQGGIGDQGPHFNVRPFENTRTGQVPGTLEHYPFGN